LGAIEGCLGKNAIARNKVMIIDGQVAIPRSPTSGSAAPGRRLKKGGILIRPGLRMRLREDGEEFCEAKVVHLECGTGTVRHNA